MRSLLRLKKGNSFSGKHNLISLKIVRGGPRATPIIHNPHCRWRGIYASPISVDELYKFDVGRGFMVCYSWN